MVLVVLLALPLLLVAACTEGPGNGRRTAASTSDPTPTPTPIFNRSDNYLQDGSTTSSGYLYLPRTYEDQIYLRGKQLHYYITNHAIGVNLCAAFYFPENSTILLTAARPQSIYNYTEGAREYYYLLALADTAGNQEICQPLAAEIVIPWFKQNQEALDSSEHPLVVAYDFLAAAATSTVRVNAGKGLKLFTAEGTPLDELNTDHLKLAITWAVANNHPQGRTCTSNQECKAWGMDCCSFGVCVNNGELRANVDTSASEFLQAAQDIAQFPEHIINYPQFYHLCANIVQPTPKAEPTVNAQEAAYQHFLEKEELYRCTNPAEDEGEVAYCTKTFYHPVFNDTAEAEALVFQAGNDDRNFYNTYSGTQAALYILQNVRTVRYGDLELVSDFIPAEFALAGDRPLLTVGDYNDNLTHGQNITIDNYKAPDDPQKTSLKTHPTRDYLKITYRIDGSCTKINTSLAKCYKVYVQGLDDATPLDHFPLSNKFKLPYYADLTRKMQVELNSDLQMEGKNWQLTGNYIEFLKNGAPTTDLVAEQGQRVKITFYVRTDEFPVLAAKEEALEKINELCKCGTTKNCNLVPVKNSADEIYDYQCAYPQAEGMAVPLQQTIFLSPKTVPLRFFDEDGAYHPTVDTSTKKQEGHLFKYLRGNLLRPNNLGDTIIGINEIFGSITGESSAAQPAKEIPVARGKTYDIFVDAGSFSSCLNCGHDYWPNIVAWLPHNYNYHGGGFAPDATLTDRGAAGRPYRADDLLFGRACFVPPTMIAGTHKPYPTTTEQRRKRLAAQHFLFANGLQRDWYGFDYGALIGSFDGVTWFAIGNQRRIKAESNKLFLAFNAWGGDLTSESTAFKIVVSDASNLENAGSAIATNADSDGAECRRYHQCDTDQDCIQQLGWEYRCQNVAQMQYAWPNFDIYAHEQANSSKKQILSRLPGNRGMPGKQCIYRGRGAACHQEYQNVPSAAASYAGMTSKSGYGLYTCASNYYCADLDEDHFNNRIARYGRAPDVQNRSSLVPENNAPTFGLAAPYFGRPYKFNATESVPENVQINLNYHNIKALCLPGKAVDPQKNIKDDQQTSPSANQAGDQIIGIGMTGTTLSSPQDNYLAYCPAFSRTTQMNLLDQLAPSTMLDLSTSEQAQDPAATMIYTSAAQNLSSNLLKIFYQHDLLDTPLVQNLHQDIPHSFVLAENSCLRAPGAACFSDQDCAPNAQISQWMNGINPDADALKGVMNRYEVKFWQEDLICGQGAAKEVLDENNQKVANGAYQLTNNTCCRPLQKKVSIATLIYDQANEENTNFAPDQIAGIDLPINSSLRYSRLSTVYDLMKTAPLAYPPLQAAPADQCGPNLTQCWPSNVLTNQANTFTELANRTCCGGHWIRNFHEQQAGGHDWTKLLKQDIEPDIFRCYNWYPTSVGAAQFSCDDAVRCSDWNECRVRQITVAEATPILEWLGTLELLGIPQIKIKNENFSDIQCMVDPSDQTVSKEFYLNVPPNLIAEGAIPEYAEAPGSAEGYYSAADYHNFDEQHLRPIFDPDTITCCLPAGEMVGTTTDPSFCCTNMIDENGRCALPDYADVS